MASRFSVIPSMLKGQPASLCDDVWQIIISLVSLGSH